MDMDLKSASAKKPGETLHQEKEQISASVQHQ